MFLTRLIFLNYFIINFYYIFINGILCPPSWSYFDDNCWFLSKNSLTYKQAERECKERFHGILGKIEDDNQKNFIQYMVDSISLDEENLIKLKDDNNNNFSKECFKRVVGKNFEIPFSSTSNSIIIFSEIINLKECLKECENVRENLNFNCLSILWYPETHDCLLNSEKESGSDKTNFSIVGIPNNILYYEYLCSDVTKISFLDDKSNNNKFIITNLDKNILEISNVRTCFGKYRHSSLKGFADKVIPSLTERECLSECWRCSNCLTNSSLCKSVTYYKESGECVMTSASIKSNREKFNDIENLSDFFDRKRECNIEDCENKEILISFIIDGSESIGIDIFNKSLNVVNEILEQINEISIYWNVILFQFGSQNYIEIESKQFDKLQDFRHLLSQIGWRREKYSNLVKSLESSMTTIGDEILKKQYDEVLTFIITDGFTNNTAIEEIPRFLIDFPSSHVYSISLTEAFDSNVLSKIIIDNDKIFSYKNYTKIFSILPEKLCTINMKENTEIFIEGKQKETQFDFNTLSMNSDIESNLNDEIWIGLGRNEYGEMKWSDKTTPNNYFKKILHNLEVEGYDGNCVYLDNNQKWMITDNCNINHKYVCSFKPSLTIEEKFKRDYSMKTDFFTTTTKSAWTLQNEIEKNDERSMDKNLHFEELSIKNNIESIKNPF